MLQLESTPIQIGFRLKVSPLSVYNFNDFQAAVEEGIVVGGGCTLLRLASKVDAIRDSLDNDEEKVSYYLLKVQVLALVKLWKSCPSYSSHKLG